MSDLPGLKAILGYDISEGISVSDYEHWLADVHFPDLLSNPYLDRIVANDIIRPVTVSSAGSPTMDEPATFYRTVATSNGFQTTHSILSAGPPVGQHFVSMSWQTVPSPIATIPTSQPSRRRDPWSPLT